MVAFTTADLKELFRKYAEVLHVDSSSTTRFRGMKLHEMSVIDNYERTQPVFFAFLRAKTDHCINKVFEAFRQLMGDSEICSLIVDRNSEESRAAEMILRPKRVLYCSFIASNQLSSLVRSLVPKESNCKIEVGFLVRSILNASTEAEFKRHIDSLKFLAPELYNQLTRDWLPGVSYWAMHKRRDCVTFDSDTNNRSKSQNKCFKECATRPWSISQSIFDITFMVYNQLHGRSIQNLKDCNSIINSFETSPYAKLLRRVTSVAGRKIYDDLQNSNDTADGTETGDPVVLSLGATSCPCKLNQNWRLPCRHLLKLYLTMGKDPEPLLVGSRWLKINPRLELRDYSTFGAIFRKRRRDYIVSHGGKSTDDPSIPTPKCHYIGWGRKASKRKVADQ